MRIIAVPHSGIAYNDSFYAAVEARGGRVVAGDCSGSWLLDNLKREDVFHIHWPSFLYVSKGSFLTILQGFIRFLMLVAIVRYRTKHIWWTAHNLFPHDRCRIAVIDVLARVLIIRLASKIFVHGTEAEKVLVKRFPASSAKCVLIPHGNWVGHYLPIETQSCAREKLALPQDAFVYLVFGQIKPYKNLGWLIKVFRETAPGDAILLIAGGFSDEQYRTDMFRLAAGDSRIRFVANFIPDDLVSTYLAASNVMCIPYRDILTSGTAMLSISYGIPFISVNRGFLRDVITDSTGILIEPGDDRELAAALQTVRTKSWCVQDILEHAKRFTFDQAASIFVAELPSVRAEIAG